MDQPANRCSFCGKKQSEVQRLIAGPGVFICNLCVALCNEVLAHELPADQRPPEPPAGPPGRGPVMRAEITPA